MKKINKTTYLKRFVRLLGIIIIMISVIKTVTAQPGTLDSSFGSNGTVTNELFGDSYCSALQEDGKIVMAGLAYEEVVIVTRYNSDGSLDKNFGKNGKVLTNLLPGYDFYYSQAIAIAIQENGKIVVAGTGFFDDPQNVNYNALLLRYNKDGSLDESFGDQGVVISDFGSDDDDIANDVALQPDGKIVIAGQNFPNVLVARYNTDGSLDETFGGIGWVNTISGRAFSVTIQEDGRIVIGGTNASIGQGVYFLLARFEPNGILDSSFGINGKVLTDFGVRAQINSVAIQSDGKIIAAGSSDPYSQEKITVTRYQSDGSIDSSFGMNGTVTTVTEGYTNSKAEKILLSDQDSKIIIAGNASDYDGSGSDFLVVRYNKDGSINDNFGITGIQITDFGESAIGKDAILQADGKIIVTGTKGNYGFALARYNSNPEETPQITRIKKWLHRHGFSWDDFPRGNKGHFSIERSANGIAFNGIARLQRSSNQQQYSYEDHAPLNGTNYYRVSAVSEDGSAVQSNIITIENNAASIKVFPIPAKNNIQIEGLPAAQKTKLSIIDYRGNVKAAATVNNGSYTWNIAHLKPGNYLLKIETGNTFVTRGFTKE